ncbi:MAG: RNase adapter RapZ [Deltaproteobacteria bacterium]|nr:RNase adapter RapZ [Deltaproteobacteria bacterium]MBW2482765.1 RNase adapter RapZ [Deltaproteobacteria bacterium]
MKNIRICIITGLSGSGKSTAMAALEDAGFYCVDNMPVELLPKFLELPIEQDSEILGVALVMDLREKGFPEKYQAIFNELKQNGYYFEILFLEAEEEVLVQRYSTTRRQHPLSLGKSLLEGIRTEKHQLKDLRSAADLVINTSKFNVHELKSKILDIAQKSKKLVPMRINVLSFGFKYGIPYDADLIMDVRFLVNPYFIPELKELDGETQEIKAFVLEHPETRTFLTKYLAFLDYLIPLYEKEGKAYLTIALGCTGGRHRSVAIARAVFEHIRAQGKTVGLNHRDRVQP